MANSAAFEAAPTLSDASGRYRTQRDIGPDDLSATPQSGSRVPRLLTVAFDRRPCMAVIRVRSCTRCARGMPCWVGGVRWASWPAGSMHGCTRHVWQPEMPCRRQPRCLVGSILPLYGCSRALACACCGVRPARLRRPTAAPRRAVVTCPDKIVFPARAVQSWSPCGAVECHM